MKLEQILANNVSEFLLRKYPKVIFRFDIGADVRLTQGQAARAKKLQGKWSKGYPDLFIAEPNEYYHGLYLELKATGNNPYRKDGTLKKNEHLERQNYIHEILRDKGYQVMFTTGLKESIEAIESYMEHADEKR